MTIKKRLINKLKPYQGWTVVFLSLSTALLTILVYSVEDWNPNYAPVFWYLFLLPVSLTAYIYGLGVGLGLSTLSTALFVPIVAKHLNAQGLSPLVVNLVMAILILNGAAILIGYFGWSHRRQRDLYRTLNLLGERFSQELQLEELLEVVLEQAMAELDANAGEILLWDESSAELIVAASRGSNELTSKTTSPPTEKSLGLWLLEQNQPYLNNALLEDPCLTHTTTFGVDLPNSLICICNFSMFDI